MLTTIRYIGSINTQHRALIGSTQKTVKGSPVTGFYPLTPVKGDTAPVEVLVGNASQLPREFTWVFGLKYHL